MSRVEALLKRYGEASGGELLAPLISQEFAGDIALVSSFGAESAVLLHMVATIDPATPVLFVDTGRLFPETLRYRDELANELGLRNVATFGPSAADAARLDADETLFEHDADACCAFRKVEPLERALAGYRAWISGRKRFHGAERASLAKVEFADWRIKINPLAEWTAHDIAAYMERHDLPAHPLVAEGYASIGCAPCTSPVAPGEDPRAGRWRGQDKTECGIHWTQDGKPIQVAAPPPTGSLTV
jgi:phosphoadenosine phosphosulfate reductase